MALDDGVESALVEAVVGRLISETQITKDLCVVCKEETGYDRETPINERRFHMKSVGPGCESCFRLYFPDEMVNGEY